MKDLVEKLGARKLTTIAMDKIEIARAATAAGAPLHRCWSCYLGGDQPCGRCESCLRFRRALDGAGITHEDGRIPRPPIDGQ